MRRARVVRFIVLLSTAIGLSLPGGALAATPPASLAGEQLSYRSAEERFTVTCDQSGESTIHYSVEGEAFGPYPGTYRETGVLTLGPQDPVAGAPVTAFDATFSIDSPAGDVEGTLTLGGNAVQNAGQCGAISGPATLFNASFPQLYDAIIHTTQGVYRDTGMSRGFLLGFHADPSPSTYTGTIHQDDFEISRGVVQQATTPCPAGVSKVNARWHYSANGSAGSWSGTKSTSCVDGSITMGPQAMEGDLKVSPGATLKAGYDFTLPGNGSPQTALVGRPQAVFTVRCVSGDAPLEATLAVPMPEQTYALLGSEWTPSGDQRSPLVFQGEIIVPDLCNGGKVRLDKGGTFTATITFF